MIEFSEWKREGLALLNSQDVSKSDLDAHGAKIERYRADIFRVEPDDLADYLVALVNIVFGHKDWFDRSVARSVLSDPRVASGFSSAVTDLHTHNPKGSNALVSLSVGGLLQSSFFRSDEDEAPYRFLSSRTAVTRKRYGVSGNYANGKAMSVMCAELILGRQHVCIGLEMGRGNDPIKSAFLSIGLSSDDAESIACAFTQKRQSELRRIDPKLKQVIFPVFGDHDVVITPVQHAGLTDEFHRRIKALREKDIRTFCRSTLVGGSQPQNAGKLNLELSGHLSHLVASVPVISYSAIRAHLYRLSRVKTAFHTRSATSIDFSNIEKARQDQRNIKKSRDRLKRAVYEAASRAISGALYLATALPEHEMSLDDPKFDGVCDTEKKFLDWRLRDGKKLSVEETQLLVEKSIQIIKRSGYESVDDDLIREFDDCFTRLIKES